MPIFLNLIELAQSPGANESEVEGRIQGEKPPETLRRDVAAVNEPALFAG
jgi:hypothetical protein